MSDGRKKRLSMLDGLAAAGAGSPPARSMMSANRALRSARDAVDAHTVWDLDPSAIEDTRIGDRMDPDDVLDLRSAIEANGQTVPILVRRHPDAEDRFLLVYGRRRLEAIRQSDKVTTIRALVAQLDDAEATRAQISENTGRRDLSFIEKALFARELVDQGFGTQTQVAEVLTVSKSNISQSLAVVDTVTPQLARAIGPAHGIGRPRWEALAKGIAASGADPAQFTALAESTRSEASGGEEDASVAAFEAVLAKVEVPHTTAQTPKRREKPESRTLRVDGQAVGTLRRSGSGVRLVIQDPGFAQWLEARADQVLEDLHARWKVGGEE